MNWIAGQPFQTNILVMSNFFKEEEGPQPVREFGFSKFKYRTSVEYAETLDKSSSDEILLWTSSQ